MLRARILVADDDRQVRRLVSLTLGSEDFQVCYAEDGTEAVRVAREVQPDLVLLDHQMPGLSGVEVCRALRTDPLTARTPIVMLTGQGHAAIRSRAFEAGVDDFLTKPFSPIGLEQKVRAMLAAPRTYVGETAPEAGPRPAGTSGPLAEDQTGGELSRAQLMLYATDLNRSMRELRQPHAELRRAYLTTVEALATSLELCEVAT